MASLALAEMEYVHLWVQAELDHLTWLNTGQVSLINQMGFTPVYCTLTHVRILSRLGAQIVVAATKHMLTDICACEDCIMIAQLMADSCARNRQPDEDWRGKKESEMWWSAV